MPILSGPIGNVGLDSETLLDLRISEMIHLACAFRSVCNAAILVSSLSTRLSNLACILSMMCSKSRLVAVALLIVILG